MRRWFVAVLAILLPLTAIAQQRSAPPPVASVQTGGDFLGMSTDQALAVGVGLIGGAIGLNALLGGTAAALIGAAAGAMIGNWWFEQRVGPPQRQTLSYSASFTGATYGAPTRR